MSRECDWGCDRSSECDWWGWSVECGCWLWVIDGGGLWMWCIGRIGCVSRVGRIRLLILWWMQRVLLILWCIHRVLLILWRIHRVLRCIGGLNRIANLLLRVCDVLADIWRIGGLLCIRHACGWIDCWLLYGIWVGLGRL